MTEKVGGYRYKIERDQLHTEKYIDLGDGPRWMFWGEGDAVPDDQNIHGDILLGDPIGAEPIITDQTQMDDRARAQQLRRDSARKEKDAAINTSVEAWGRGEGAVARLDEARDMPYLDRAAIHMGESAVRHGRGFMDFMDMIINEPGMGIVDAAKHDPFNQPETYLEELLGGPPGGTPIESGGAPDSAYERAQSPLYERTRGRQAEQEEQSRVFKEIRDYSTGAEFVGELPLFLGSGAVADLTKAGNMLRFSRFPFKPGEFRAPINLRPQRDLPGPKDLFRLDIKEDLARQSLVSGLESGANPEESFWEGAGGGLIGAGIGRAGAARFERAPNYNNPEMNRILQDLQDEGYVPSPGMKTGDARLLSEELGLRSNKELINRITQFDDANNKVVLRKLMRAIGMDDANVDIISGPMMKNHMDQLSIRYNELAGDTKGIMDPGLLSSVKKRANTATQTPEGEIAKKSLNAWVDRIRGMGNRFTGEEYQQFRKEIKDAYQVAKRDGNYQLYSGYEDLMAGLDQGIDRGMRQGLGTGDYESWKQLNEQFMLSSMVKDEGLDPFGRLKLREFGDYVYNNNADRMLMENTAGTPIGDIYDIAKIEYYNKTAGGPNTSLSSTSVETPEKETAGAFFRSTPASRKATPAENLFSGMYYGSGYPSTTGLLGIPMDSSFRISQLGRASAQAGRGEHSLDEVEHMYRNLIQDTGGFAFDWLNP